MALDVFEPHRSTGSFKNFEKGEGVTDEFFVGD